MKKINMAMAAMVCTAAFSFAQDDPPPPALGDIPPEARIQLLKKFDKDGDGRLNAEERKAAFDAMKDRSADLEDLRKKHVEEIMKKFDKDGDGKLDQAELSTFLDEQRKMFDEQRRRMGPGRNFTPPKEILEKFDKDGDGKLSDDERKTMFKEARERRAALIKKYDADGDGVLSDAERVKLTQDPEVQDMMKRMLSHREGGQPPPPPAE